MSSKFYFRNNSLFAKVVFAFLFFACFQFAFAAADSVAVGKERPFIKFFGPPPPPKIDMITTFREKYVNANFFFWSKALKAGFGTVLPEALPM